MPSRIKILRSAYRRLKQSQLPVFADHVIKRTLDHPDYTDVQAQVSTLANHLSTFNSALTAALRGGVAETVRKDLAKTQLLRSLDALCDALERQPQADVAFIANAGLSPWPQRQQDTGAVPAPRLIQVQGTGRRGQVHVRIGDAKTTSMLNYAVEYSTDQGATWTNGTYSSTRSFVVNDLPPSRDLQLRVQVLATRLRRSDWSAPVAAAVA